MFFYYWMIVQVLGENLPISSSGHVALLQKFLEPALSPATLHMWYDHGADFDNLLQGVSALIFLGFFFCSWWQLVVKRPVSVYPLLDIQVWKHNIVPVIFFGMIADGITFVFWYSNIACMVQLPLSVGFAITGFLLYATRWSQEKKDMNIWSIQSAMIVGCMQGVALVPGISRFAITVTTLQWLGYDRRVAFLVSFLLQWPLIVAGSIQGYFALQGTDLFDILYQPAFLITVILLAVLSYGILCGVAKIIEKNQLWKFSYYMMLVSIIAVCV